MTYHKMKFVLLTFSSISQFGFTLNKKNFDSPNQMTQGSLQSVHSLSLGLFRTYEDFFKSTFEKSLAKNKIDNVSRQVMYTFWNLLEYHRKLDTSAIQHAVGPLVASSKAMMYSTLGSMCCMPYLNSKSLM